MKQPSGTFRLVVMEYPAGQKGIWWAYAIDEWDLALSEARRMAAKPNTQVGINLVYFDRPHEEKVTVSDSKDGMR